MKSVRRLASLLVIVVAGAASLATSPPPPSAPPSLDETVEGTAELSAEHPAIVRLVDIRVSGLDPKLSGRASVLLTPTAAGSDPDLDGAGEIRASIVSREAGSGTATVGPSGAFRSLLDSAKPPRPVDLICAEGACEGHFALVVDAVGLERGADRERRLEGRRSRRPVGRCSARRPHADRHDGPRTRRWCRAP